MPTEGDFEKRLRKPFKAIVDISSAWDAQSYNDIFLEAVRKFPFYRSNALYHCNVAYKVRGLKDRVSKGGRISCATEEEMHEGASPIDYAFGEESEKDQVILVLDPDKFERVQDDVNSTEYAYRLKPGTPFDETIVAILNIKG